MEDERNDLEREGEPEHGGRTSGDPDERTIPPAEEPHASNGTTAAEQREGRDLDRRVEEDQPDGGQARREQARRLRERGWGLTDQEKDLVADEAEVAAAPPAEEEAVRVEEDQAPGGTEGPDRYVEDDTTGR
jgi:hypothetical protein